MIKAEIKKSPLQDKALFYLVKRSLTYFFAESETIVVSDSVTIVADESVAITVVSVVITAVESVDVFSVLGLLWQAATVNILPMNSRANAFLITFNTSLYLRGKYTFFIINAINTSLISNKRLLLSEKYYSKHNLLNT